MSRLEQLRNIMKINNVSCYIIPTEDTHMSEYIAHVDKRREFISSFSGSAGTAVVTREKALLWTDGRYYLQASNQLGSEWQLMKMGLKDVPSIKDYLKEELRKDDIVGIDGKLFTIDNASELKKELGERGILLKHFDSNFVDQVWKDQPAEPIAPVKVLDIMYAGKTVDEKLNLLRTEITKNHSELAVISALDEICWLFNLRGNDIDFNPVFKAFSVVALNDVTLYIDNRKLSETVVQHLENVKIAPYEQIYADLENCKQKVLVNGKTNLALIEAIGANYVLKPSPVEMTKAIKNSTELEGFRQCHKRDAVALCRYFSWLEHQLKSGAIVTEASGADHLEKLRSELDLFQGLSFDTISSTGANGAIIHYKPEHGTCKVIELSQMYLCDSGGQYLDGTTDVTRTMHFGTPTNEEKECFTRVLKGHIEIDKLVFPSGTTGYRIDSMARMHLWQAGLDFRHGTGHGVGSFLNVHEGPHGNIGL